MADLKVLALGSDITYIDTTWFEDKDQTEVELMLSRHNRRKLKDLVKIYLGTTIQEDCHSSLIDARAAMALFMSRKSYLL